MKWKAACNNLLIIRSWFTLNHWFWLKYKSSIHNIAFSSESNACNAKFLQISSNEETNSSTSWMACGGWVHFQLDVDFWMNYCISWIRNLLPENVQAFFQFVQIIIFKLIMFCVISKFCCLRKHNQRCFNINVICVEGWHRPVVQPCSHQDVGFSSAKCEADGEHLGPVLTQEVVSVCV